MAEDLIAAVSTPWGRGAVGIVRLSGPGAGAAVEGIFSPADGRPLGDHPPRTLVYGALRDGEGGEVDRVLCTWSPAPHSYTGEETAEVQCHGSPTVLTLALEALFARGARQALPGEFTKRAFLNGKLDLAQAEGVVDLIDAETPAAVRHAAGQLAGRLSRHIEEIYRQLTDLLAHFHAVLDYPDEDIDPFGEQTIRETLADAKCRLEALLSGYRRGRYLHSGLPCAIVGRPNVGKSTLLNALLGYERAIVTEVPGTTRDTVEERCVVGGVLLRIIDTAGLRETVDPVERMGVERSLAALEGAALALVLTEPGTGHDGQDAGILAQAREKAERVVVLSTKSDLHPEAAASPHGPGVISISAKTGAGLDALEAEVARLFPGEARGEEGQSLTNARQAEAAGRALEAVDSALCAQEAGFPPDAVLTDVEHALTALGELTGKRVREDVTERIFARFCVGK